MRLDLYVYMFLNCPSFLVISLQAVQSVRMIQELVAKPPRLSRKMDPNVTCEQGVYEPSLHGA